MKKNLLFLFLLLYNIVYAQIPEDALRYSFYPQNGSARSLAIGGAMGSLGGDISANYVNPAGLGMYRTSEFVFTPGLFFNNNQTNFRGTNTESNKSSFDIGTSGFIIGANSPFKENTSYAFSMAVTQTASFNNTIHYSGFNNYSSYAEQWVEQIAQSGETIDQVLSDPQYAFGAAPALYTYLVDTFRVNDTTVQLKSMPEFVLNKGNALLQDNIIDTKGGIYEIAISFASNKNNRLLIGGSLGIPILHYENTTTFTETDTSSDHNNNFNYFKYTDAYKVTGAGVNLKLGLIYKPNEHIRLGVAVHSPTYMSSLKETRSTYLETNTENYNSTSSISSNDFTGGQPGLNKYDLFTPFKAIISGSYMFGETEDVTQQRGFITADIEYVHHHGSAFYSASDVPTSEDQNYYNALNSIIRDQYKGNLNFRAGGELKFNTIMCRLGFAYYGNPYKDAALQANKLLFSGGIGYRNKGYFIDLTYVYSINKDVNFPYRLEDKNNTFGTIKNQRGNIVATVGFKF